MDRARTDDRRSADVTPQRYQEQDDDTEPSSDATLEFEGKIGVADEDRGADPYNRTGRFKRAVR